ncbi:MAG: lysophospholipid acyltransferase family protein [Endomicrobia bacterium]|nr:lysophospholipid acyltransferase family protein [Bacillota bacterium]MCL1972780.1 lysophospholipid acyltransferase family protein [Endomicrobiia bacterium]
MNKIITKVRRKIYYCGAYISSKIILLLPYRFSIDVVSVVFGTLAYYSLVGVRVKAKRNLERCFPEKTKKEICGIVKNIFINQAKNFFELANFPRMDSAFLRSISSIENSHLIKEGIKKGKGILFVSAHTGNWEITAAAVADMGVPVNVVAKKIYIEELNDMLVGYRTNKNVSVILRDAPDTGRKLLKALKKGEIIAMLIDQDTNVPGVFVDFFGEPAWTPSGLAVLALRTGAEVLVGIDQRIDQYGHKTVVSGPLTIDPSGNFDADVVNLTQKASLVLEDHIRKYLEQWVWFHERWKTKGQLTINK